MDTGQQECYDNSQQISCPSAGAAFYGQDAQYNGAAPGYVDNGDGTITDLTTGLMWQKTPDLASKSTYVEAVSGATSFNLAGYTDWRLPAIKELYSLIDFTGSSFHQTPYIDTDYFDFRFGDESAGERLIDAQYWSSTEYVGSTMNGNATVFGVNFADGRIKGYPRDARPGRATPTQFVRYVRGNSDYGINHFVDNGNGAITDLATGLMWQKTDDSGTRNWEEALAYAENLTLAGYDDWRLPNAKEMQSMVDYTRAPDAQDAAQQGPAIEPIFGITETESYFWTSTTHLDGPDASAAVYVCFGQAFGYMGQTGSAVYMNVHGAGAQRSDPKSGDPSNWPEGRGPQGDDIRIYNYVRAVRGPVNVGVTATAVVNAASYSGSAIAPGSIASAFGQYLSGATTSANQIPLPTSLGGLTISITDSADVQRDCGQFFISPAQGNFLVPAETELGPATLTLSSENDGISTIPVTVDRVVPGLFTMNASGEGVGAILTLREAGDGSRTEGEAFQFDTGTQRFVASPIDLDDSSDKVYLMLFGTGIRGCGDSSSVSATIGGEPVPVIGAAAPGEFEGLDQVNLGPLPRSLSGRGEVDIVLTVDGKTANRVTISIQ